MPTRLTCSTCGKVLSNRYLHGFVKVGYAYIREAFGYDLCEKCSKSFEKIFNAWLNSMPLRDLEYIRR